jgi:hypothetical protein
MGRYLMIQVLPLAVYLFFIDIACNRCLVKFFMNGYKTLILEEYNKVGKKVEQFNTFEQLYSQYMGFEAQN